MSGIDGADWAGIITAITALITAIGFACKWLINFIVSQANQTNDVLKAENTALKDRIEILEVKADARERAER